MSISPVPAELDVAAAFFALRLACQTDVADVAAALASGSPAFVLLDTRSDAAWAQGHIPGAHHLPTAAIAAAELAAGKISRQPVVLIRGVDLGNGQGTVTGDVVMPRDFDLFR